MAQEDPVHMCLAGLTGPAGLTRPHRETVVERTKRAAGVETMLYRDFVQRREPLPGGSDRAAPTT